jgi:tetratricopeptide (TPR) repeat protein
MTLGATFGDGSRVTPASRAGGTNRPNGEPQASLSDKFSWPGRILLLAAAVISPWIFGSVQYWPQQWIAISLLAGLAFWWFETAMNTRRAQVFPYLFFPLAIGICIGLIQLVELPSWASGLLGRQAEIYSTFSSDSAAGASISVNRDGTLHHLRLLSIALAALLLGCRYFRTRRDIMILLTTMTANGVAISLFGIIHRLTDIPGRMFWTFKITLGGTAFGPFVNRNNACGYLLICMACAIGLLPILMPARNTTGPKLILSSEIPFWRQVSTALVQFIAELNARKMAVLIAIVLIGTGMIVSMSRGGVLAMLFGGAVTIIAYGMARQPKNSMFVFIPLILLVGLLIGFATLGEGISERFEKIDLVDVEKDNRVEHWQNTWPATKDFGILGSGLGSYSNAHRGYRIKPELTVFHYAENQYFQALVEAGWIGLGVYFVAWIIAIQSASHLLSKGQSPTTIGVGVMGTFLIASEALASFFDFGFYIAANTLALAIMFGFLSYHAQALGGRLKKQSWLRFHVHNYAIQAIVLVMFGIISLTAYDLYTRSNIQRLSTPLLTLLTRENMPLEATDKKLAQLMPLVKSKPTPKGLNYAAGLWVHRCRLELFNEMIETQEFKTNLANAGGDEGTREKIFKKLWNTTHLQRLQENITYLTRESKYELANFKSKPAINKNLSMAAQLLSYSIDAAPMQPLPHQRLGQIIAVLGERSEADVHFENTLKLAPANPQFHNVAGLYYLQSDRPEKAAPHLRRYLELRPHRFALTMALVTARTNRSIMPVAPAIISQQIIPDDPSMLYKYAISYSSDTPELRNLALTRAVNIMEENGYHSVEEMELMGNIRKLQGKKEAAIESYSAMLRIRPNNAKVRMVRVNLLQETGQYELALEDIEKVIAKSNTPEKYRKQERQLRDLVYARERNQRSNNQ